MPSLYLLLANQINMGRILKTLLRIKSPYTGTKPRGPDSLTGLLMSRGGNEWGHTEH